MKTLFLFRSTKSNQTKVLKQIQRMNFPSCKTCAYYLPAEYNGRDARCGKFGKKDIVRDTIFYDLAEYCREDKAKCGLNGISFVKDSPWRVKWKELKHSQYFFAIKIACVYASCLFVGKLYLRFRTNNI